MDTGKKKDKHRVTHTPPPVHHHQRTKVKDTRFTSGRLCERFITKPGQTCVVIKDPRQEEEIE